MSTTIPSLPNRILVADDEEMFRRSTVDILRSRGYQADGVCDASEGENALKSNSYDLVIVDLQMNGNTDLAFVRSVSANNKIPSMIVTGFPTLKSAVESIHLMIVDYLIKPINPQEFLNRVETALRKKHSVVNCYEQKTGNKLVEVNGPALQTAMSLDQILAHQIGEMYRALEGLQLATQIASEQPGITSHDLCQYSKCSNLEKHRDMLKETVATLMKTKNSFKSKELADLRARIETFLAS